MSFGCSHHDPRTVADLTSESESECRIFETVSPPLENALSTSVDVAGAERKSRAMRARGCPTAFIDVHHAIGSLTVGIGGAESHSDTGSVLVGVLDPKFSSSMKYLLVAEGFLAVCNFTVNKVIEIHRIVNAPLHSSHLASCNFSPIHPVKAPQLLRSTLVPIWH
jgi:hypothetical protein